MRYRSKMYDIPVEQREKILALDKKWHELLKTQCNNFEEIGSKYPHAWNDIVQCVKNREITIENVTLNHPEVLASDLINLYKGQDAWQTAHKECFDYAEKCGINGVDIRVYKTNYGDFYSMASTDICLDCYSYLHEYAKMTDTSADMYMKLLNFCHEQYDIPMDKLSDFVKTLRNNYADVLYFAYDQSCEVSGSGYMHDIHTGNGITSRVKNFLGKPVKDFSEQYDIPINVLICLIIRYDILATNRLEKAKLITLYMSLR